MSGSSGDIRLGMGGPHVGEVHLDPTAIRGEGGWHDPRLVVPLRLVMHPQPMEHQIALIRLVGSLHLRQTVSPSDQLGTAATLDLLDNIPCRSVPSGPAEHTPELRFTLTQPLVTQLEELRHRASDNRMSLYLRLRGALVWLRHTGNSQSPHHPEKSTIGEGGWEPSVGMFSEVLPFWNSHIGTLQIDIEPSIWVDDVLPGIGYDRVRLVEIQLSQMPSDNVFLAQFDKARRKYDAGDYDGCIQECRGIQNAWEKVFGATRNKVIAKVLAQRLHWPEDDWHTRMLDSIWKGYADMVNAPHHPERTPPPLRATPSDARLCLLLTAILSEYIERLRKDYQP